MTMRPDDVPYDHGTARPPGGPVEVDGAPATEGISTADVAERIDEDPEQADRTDVEGSPTGHS